LNNRHFSSRIVDLIPLLTTSLEPVLNISDFACSGGAQTVSAAQKIAYLPFSRDHSKSGFSRATFAAIARNCNFALQLPSILSALLGLDSDKKCG
jgi:hypothetical protein